MSQPKPVLRPLSKQRQEEFLILLEEHHAAFVRYVRAMTRDSEQARDVVAETLLIALERFDTLREPKSFLFFLIAIARRYFWRMNKWASLFTRMEAKHEELIIDQGTAADVQPDLRLLHECIARLPAKQREALVLFELSGLSLSEIHALQGGSLSGVKTRIARARQKLAQRMDESPRGTMREKSDTDVVSIEIEAER
ncbi:MAG: RNA polymerase sigma factor [Bacteroidota bacterium]